MPAEIADKVDISGDQPESTAAGAGLRQAAAIQRAQEHAAAPPHEDSRPPAAPAAPKEKPAESPLGGLADAAGAAKDLVTDPLDTAKQAAGIVQKALPQQSPAMQFLSQIEKTGGDWRSWIHNPLAPHNPNSYHPLDYDVARAVGRAWNTLINPSVITESIHNIQNDSSAMGQRKRDILGYTPFGTMLGLGPNGKPDPHLQWWTDNVLPELLTMGADFNWVTFGASMAGELPQHAGQVPGQVAQALPLSEFGALIHGGPQTLEDPVFRERLFWKAASAGLMGLSALPMLHWAKNLRGLDPAALTHLHESVAKLKDLQPERLTSDEALQRAMGIGPVHNVSLFAKAASDVRTMQQLPGGELMDVTARARKRILRDLDIKDKDLLDLVDASRSWTKAQFNLARRALPQVVPWDLYRKTAMDRVPEDPRDLIEQIPDQHFGSARVALNSAMHLVAQVYRGPAVDPVNAAESMVHGIMGNSAADDFISHKYLASLANLRDQAGIDGRKLMKALRDPETLAALSPLEKMTLGLIQHPFRSLRDASVRYGYRKDFIPNYEPRVQIEPKGKAPVTRRGKPLTAASKAHRSERFAEDPEDPSKLVLTEKYATVFDLNKAMLQFRKEAAARIQKEGAALEDATAQAEALFPTYHEDLFDAVAHVMPRQLHALHSHISAQQALQAIAQDGRKLAFREGEHGIPSDYKTIAGAPRTLQGIRFHPKFADPLERAQGARDNGNMELMFKLNRLATTALMWSPMIHGDNMAGRALELMGTHPTRWYEDLTRNKGKALTEVQKLSQGLQEEMDAINAGVIPHIPGRKFLDTLYSAHGQAFGDPTLFEHPSLEDQSQVPAALRSLSGVGKAAASGYESLQDLLWGRWVWGGGQKSFRVERAAIEHSHPDLPDVAKDQYAAYRANRWQGHIEPTAWSQTSWTLSRSLGFAVNWLRSFYELQLPTYLGRSAVAAHPELRGYILRNELQTVRGMLLAQQVTGNFANLALSGHPQYIPGYGGPQNQPENRFYIEIGNPGVIKALQAFGLYRNIDPNTGRDPKTGGVLAIANPFGRQQLQEERLLGQEPGTSPMQGAQDIAAGHTALDLSPMLAALNVDLPFSIMDGAVKRINPREELGPHMDTLQASLEKLFALNPFEQVATMTQQAQQAQVPDFLKSAPIPDGLKKFVGPGLSYLFGALSGAQPPKTRYERTPGPQASDENWLKYDDLKAQRDKLFTQKSQLLTSGSITPNEWKQWYSGYAPHYATQVETLLGGSGGQALGGSKGLYAQWENLYSKAELPDGSGVDWGKLDQLQADFKSKLSQGDLNMLTTSIAQAENADPALGMYHAAINAHESFINQLEGGPAGASQIRQLLSDYYQLSSADRRHFEAQNPQIKQYFTAVDKWETESWAGRMYSLFYQTSAMHKWLTQEFGHAGTPQLEQQQEERGLEEVQQHYAAS